MRVLWIAAGAVFLDQVSKIVVVRTIAGPPYRPVHVLGDWLKFTFTENPGMAFGITFGPTGLVTVFSIIATVLILFYLFRVRKGYAPYRASLGLIFGGAIGNIIDRVFYGKIFGYGGFFEVKVVDFIFLCLPFKCVSCCAGCSHAFNSVHSSSCCLNPFSSVSAPQMRFFLRMQFIRVRFCAFLFMLVKYVLFCICWSHAFLYVFAARMRQILSIYVSAVQMRSIQGRLFQSVMECFI